MIKKYYFLILLIVFAFGQLIGQYHVFDFLIILGVLANFRKIFIPKYVLFWICVAGISLILNKFYLEGLFYLLRWVIYALFYFAFLKNISKEFYFKPYLLLSFCLICLIGLIQYIFLPNVSFLAVNGWDDHYYRLTFPFLDPGFTGIILLVGLLYILNLKKYILLPIFFIALMLTYSRATYLAYLVSFGFLAFSKKSLKIFLIAVLFLVMSIPLLPQSTGEGTKLARENSIISRINNWKQSAEVWKTSPIYGIGFNNYRLIAGNKADSSIMLVLATTGAIGLLGYLGLLKTLIEINKKNALFLAILAGVFAHSWFNNTLFYAPVMFLLWTFMEST